MYLCNSGFYGFYFKSTYNDNLYTMMGYTIKNKHSKDQIFTAYNNRDVFIVAIYEAVEQSMLQFEINGVTHEICEIITCM